MVPLVGIIFQWPAEHHNALLQILCANSGEILTIIAATAVPVLSPEQVLSGAVCKEQASTSISTAA